MMIEPGGSMNKRIGPDGTSNVMKIGRCAQETALDQIQR